MAQLVDGLCEQAILFSEKLSAQGFQILNQVVFNQILLACDTPEETQKTLAHIQASGECWCGGALWKNQPVIRISVSSWATTTADIDRSVKAFVASRGKAGKAG